MFRKFLARRAAAKRAALMAWSRASVAAYDARLAAHYAQGCTSECRAFFHAENA